MTNVKNRVFLKNVRCTFPVLFDPKQYKGKGDFFYSINFLMPADDPNLAAIKAAASAAAKAKWGEKTAEKIKSAVARDKLPWHDGDNNADKPYGAAYKGLVYVSARTNAKSMMPSVYDKDPDPVSPKRSPAGKLLPRPLKATEGKPYSGCYVNAWIDVFAYENEGVGIGAGLAGVQFHADGERLAGGTVAREDDFEAVESPIGASMPGEFLTSVEELLV